MGAGLSKLRLGQKRSSESERIDKSGRLHDSSSHDDFFKVCMIVFRLLQPLARHLGPETVLDPTEFIGAQSHDMAPPLPVRRLVPQCYLPR